MPSDVVTASDEPQWTFNAFFSYRRPFRDSARRLERDLHAIAKRHVDHDKWKVFLDASSLRSGPLKEELFSALRQSRCLVVLLDAETATSSWVADEITHWLETVGSADRLHLVKMEASAEVQWNKKQGRFDDSEVIPVPLRNLFDTEPKWTDFSARNRFRGQEDDLPGLCAPLMDVNTHDFGLVEARHQRRRARVRTVLIAVMAALLVIATVGAVVAVVNQQRAEESANRALAEADSAEALLATDNSPTLAIERALRASTRSDSPTVRSAMLAVSQAARRLTRAVTYPESETGHPAENARFSSDGTTLAAWGRDRAPGKSRVQTWNVATGAVPASVTVNARDLHDAILLGDRFLAACSASGPVLVDLVAASTNVLDKGWRDGPGRICDVREFDEGVVLLGTDTAGGGLAHVIDGNGEVRTTEGVTTISAHPFARSAILAGPAGVVVVTSGAATPVSKRPGAQTGFADAGGNFVVAWGPQEWGVITQGAGGPALRPITVPAGTVDVAPVLDIGRMTGELAWITGDGTIGWTGDETRTRVENSQGEPVWTPYSTRLEPLAYQDFVAVYRNTAAVVRPPGAYPAVDAPSDVLPTTGTTDWTQLVVQERIGVPEQGGGEPVVARCADHTAVLLATDLPEGGSLLVDGSGDGHTLEGRGAFTARCDAVDVGNSLVILPDSGEPVELRSTLVADTVALSPVGDQVAIVKAGFPIEVLSTLPANELPRPWDVATGRGGTVTAFGERELFVEGVPNERLVIADASGIVGRIPLSGSVEITAARPDGDGAALIELPSKRVLLVDGQESVPAHATCSAGTVSYVPGADFMRSYDAAEAQIPAIRYASGATDCRSGREFYLDPALEIVAYDVGESTGRIVARVGDRVTVTTWSRGDNSSVRTLDGPPLLLDDANVSFDPTGQVALTYSSGGRRLTLHRRAGDTWNAALSIATGLPEVVHAQVVDNATLILAVSGEGGFELFDVTTGRLVASDPGLVATFEPVTGFSARRVGEHLFVIMQTAGDSTATATVRIPIGIYALKRQLCGLYRADGCAQ